MTLTSNERQLVKSLSKVGAIMQSMYDPSIEILWNLLTSFKRTENWGDYKMMNPVTMWTIEAIRKKFNADQYFIVHCGFDLDGHSENSMHYLAKAIDFHVANLSFIDAIAHMELTLEELGLTDLVGLGIYLDWSHKGFHLDTRGEKARWGRIIKDGKPTYVSFEEAKSLANSL